MAFGFLFWLFFSGLIVASLQDLKRREVDNWLNLFLLFASFSFIFFRVIFERDATVIFQAGFVLVIMFVLMNFFYYGRVFAGGDVKLLFAMGLFFLGAGFAGTLINIGIFLLFLMFAGSIYGMLYSLVLYAQDFKRVNEEIRKGFAASWVKFSVVVGAVLLALSFVSGIFLFFSVFALALPVLFVFAKGLESVSMIKVVSGKELREGDWLVDDIKVGKRVIRADWGGLSSEDVKLLRKRKKIKIKEGIPFVPAFLIAFILYVLLRGWLIGVIFQMV